MASSALPERRSIARRMCIAVIVTLFYKSAHARPQLGDQEWMRRFRELVKTFNAFLEVLNDGKLDVARWNAVRAAWRDVDVA
jgi:hypothetical protein